MHSMMRKRCSNTASSGYAKRGCNHEHHHPRRNRRSRARLGVLVVGARMRLRLIHAYAVAVSLAMYAAVWYAFTLIARVFA